MVNPAHLNHIAALVVNNFSLLFFINVNYSCLLGIDYFEVILSKHFASHSS
jgi:hypothetical protein